MHAARRGAGIGLLVVMAGHGLPAATAAPARVQLEPAPLPSPEATLSPADMRGTRVSTREGAIYPRGHTHCTGAAAETRPQDTFALGATRCAVARNGDAFTLTVGEAAPIAIPAELIAEEKRLRLGPVRFDLPGVGAYALAFTAGIPAGAKGRSCVIYRAGLMRKGGLDGLEVALYDGDLNGAFEKGKDGLRVGPASGRIRVFASSAGLVSTGPKVYRCATMAKDGSTAEFLPYEGETGRIAVNFAEGGLEMQLVLGSKEAGCHAVAGPASGEYAVVPGEYTVLYGLAYDPKKNDVVAAITPGLQKPVRVAAGGRATLSFGGPYRYAFEPTVQDGTLKIKGNTVKVLGAGGEEYVTDDRTNPPAVAVRVGGRDQALGKMRYG